MMPGDMMLGAPNGAGTKNGSGLGLILLAFVGGAAVTFIWMHSRQVEMIRKAMLSQQMVVKGNSEFHHPEKL